MSLYEIFLITARASCCIIFTNYWCIFLAKCTHAYIVLLLYKRTVHYSLFKQNNIQTRTACSLLMFQYLNSKYTYPPINPKSINWGSRLWNFHSISNPHDCELKTKMPFTNVFEKFAMVLIVLSTAVEIINKNHFYIILICTIFY